MAVSDATRRTSVDLLWAIALLLFGVLDVAITVAALDLGVAGEGNPLVQGALHQHGLVVLPVWKAAVLVGFYTVYRQMPAPYDVGVPAGLAITGCGVMAWNVALLAVSVP
ncbi:DUF5658 family protein [Haloarchaeobius sp. TZWWS8]|uniref:DUF5658 family protein n=1 Tax=Haloarchaeobius sp. TZWWS8 TaxID=3446121 RepID=UPI003EBC6DC6